MDTLVSLFTKQIINELNYEDLISLSNLLDIDDENLYKFHRGLSTTIDIEDNRISKLFKEFRYIKE